MNFTKDYNTRVLYAKPISGNIMLPSYNWQRDVEIKNDFNNNLIDGFSQGLSLYGPEQDINLFNKLDLDPISTTNVNFDKINEIVDNNYNKNDDIYNNTKAVIVGAVDQINKSGDDTVDNVKNVFSNLKNEIKNVFDFDLSSLKIYGGLLVLFLLITRR